MFGETKPSIARIGCSVKGKSPDVFFDCAARFPRIDETPREENSTGYRLSTRLVTLAGWPSGYALRFSRSGTGTREGHLPEDPFQFQDLEKLGLGLRLFRSGRRASPTMRSPAMRNSQRKPLTS